MKKCPHCDRERKFWTNGKYSRYFDTCGSKECLRKSHPQYDRGQTKERMQLICEQCNNTFKVLPYKKHRRFCSPHCAREFQRKSKVERICEYCGVIFVRSPSHRNRFCSNKCAVDSGFKREVALQSNLKQQRGNSTKPERLLYGILEHFEIPHEKQKKIFHWIVDAYLPLGKVIVQVDGDYWHGNKELYPDNDEPRIRKRIGRDTAMDKWFIKNGYQVVRMWASHIENNPLSVVNTLIHLYGVER